MHATPPAPMMVRRPDRRLEVRHGDVVLLQSMDRGPVIRVEAYLTDPADGIEMWQGYLSDAGTPRRLEFLRLWVQAGLNLAQAERQRARAPLSDRARRALQYALWDLQIMGQVLRSSRFRWPRVAAARAV